MRSYEALKPREHRWLKVGHRLLGQRVRRTFDGQPILGTVTKWLPADLAEGDPALVLTGERVTDRVREGGSQSVRAPQPSSALDHH